MSIGEGLDWAYLRAHPHNLERLIEHQRIRTTPLPNVGTCRIERLTMDDGSSVFAKSCPGSDPALLVSEAVGLRWIAAAKAVPVPEVVVDGPMLLLEWIEAGPPTASAATGLGRDLAALHSAGSPSLGAAWPGFIGPLPMDNTPAASWPEFYAHQRVLPFLRQARDTGRMAPEDVSAIERALVAVEVPTEAPSRVHGDLWNGNVLWSAAGPAYVIDPSAHGGHRETDLAMLALFGLPHLEVLLAAYVEASPLADGWRERVAFHQLHPLCVHAAIFGEDYGARAGAAARQYL